ncbi:MULTISPECIES: glutathione S-transferase C-terminal domain-containing protein [unclassified Pseudomonas]|uniref:glutathione S-transferase family protein n=1 Tax=unclassified Pseudomonas TaxID=196821 RepID=UPI00244A207C|nr:MULTISPECIES: glutathione S-transferase C-terminal domain-containing protein [unclassified Pseudomonas]MDG9924723.1 glutathione binding-like protein [Pseudomonas sp. GD04045]MDH0036704.1 glutathione binding-like protein [Pseudomonas sp. GD04019]
MHPILFYGVPQGCSFGSLVALEWLGQPYLLNRVEMLEQPWDRLYTKVNPLLQTPALLLEDDRVLTESLAILLHLNGRGLESGIGIAPGTAQYDRLVQTLAFLNTDFFAAFIPLWKAYELADLGEAEQQLLRRLGGADVAMTCAHLERLLTGKQWLLGERRSLADAYLAGLGRWVQYHHLFDLQRDYPNLHAYLGRLADDPAVRHAWAIERGEHMGRHVSLEELRPRLEAL